MIKPRHSRKGQTSSIGLLSQSVSTSQRDIKGVDKEPLAVNQSVHLLGTASSRMRYAPISQSPAGYGSSLSASQGFPFTISYVKFGLILGLFPPIAGMLLCVFIATSYHHANTTQTHCNVDNWLPSFSSAIGNNYPEVCLLITH